MAGSRATCTSSRKPNGSKVSFKSISSRLGCRLLTCVVKRGNVFSRQYYNWWFPLPFRSSLGSSMVWDTLIQESLQEFPDGTPEREYPMLGRPYQTHALHRSHGSPTCRWQASR